MKKFRFPKKTKLKRFFRSRPGKIMAIIFFFFILLIPLSLNIFADLPSPKRLEGQSYPVSTQIFDRSGILLYEIYADTNRTPIPLNSIPSEVIQATLAIEDSNFYHHFGFSFQGIVRALKNTIIENKLQGGSTITQQLVKTALLENSERTVKRKVREAVLTVAVELIYTKDHILEMYLNHIPYGGTAYGIESAAKRYFNKSAPELNLAEASLLAGLPQAPSRYSPFINPDRAKARQQEVLRRLVEEGYINLNTADRAFEQELVYAPPATNIKAPHFVFYIKSLLEDKYGLEKVERGGLRVTTSLDLTLQESIQASLSAEVESLNKYKVGNGAALVTNPQTGEILAMIGSKDYFNSAEDGQVNLTNRLRQPGSSIKPLNYVTALQLKILNPASILLDYPTCFKVGVLSPYCPKNYDGSFHGPVSLRDALANSYNIPAVKVLAINGLESMIATASAMGISTFTDPSRYGLSLTLGGGEVTMMDMATAFGTLANQGVKVPLNPILNVSDYTGQMIESYEPSQTVAALSRFYDENDLQSNLVGTGLNGLTRVLNREPAFLISDILADNNARSAAFGPNSALRIKDQIVSVKTGTTNDLKDNWTIGYTPDFVTAVWVGNNDNTPMNPYLVSGVTGAAPIWNDIMSFLLKDKEASPSAVPAGIDRTNVCKISGLYPRNEEPCELRYESFWKEAMPKDFHSLKKNLWVTKDTGLPAFLNNSDQPPSNSDGLELKEHLVYSDPLVTDYCLDCPWPVSEDGKIQYPKVTVDTVAKTSRYILPPTLAPAP